MPLEWERPEMLHLVCLARSELHNPDAHVGAL